MQSSHEQQYKIVFKKDLIISSIDWLIDWLVGWLVGIVNQPLPLVGWSSASPSPPRPPWLSWLQLVTWLTCPNQLALPHRLVPPQFWLVHDLVPVGPGHIGWFQLWYGWKLVANALSWKDSWVGQTMVWLIGYALSDIWYGTLPAV